MSRRERRELPTPCCDDEIWENQDPLNPSSRLLEGTTERSGSRTSMSRIFRPSYSADRLERTLLRLLTGEFRPGSERPELWPRSARQTKGAMRSIDTIQLA
jgi:hypothetical protein